MIAFWCLSVFSVKYSVLRLVGEGGGSGGVTYKEKQQHWSHDNPLQENQFYDYHPTFELTSQMLYYCRKSFLTRKLPNAELNMAAA